MLPLRRRRTRWKLPTTARPSSSRSPWLSLTLMLNLSSMLRLATRSVTAHAHATKLALTIASCAGLHLRRLHASLCYCFHCRQRVDPEHEEDRLRPCARHHRLRESQPPPLPTQPSCLPALLRSQNQFFVDECGFFPEKFTDFSEEANADRLARGSKIAQAALGELAKDPRNIRTHRLLGGLGSHDLSAMRELIGMPKSCFAASRPVGAPFLTAMLEYEGFTALYETGLDSESSSDLIELP